MDNRVSRDVVRGLASLGVLAGLVVGVPIALLSIAGWPLPTSLPRWSAVMHALGRSEVADSTLIKGAALVCFAAWAVLVVCVVVELAAWVAGRTAARLPVVGPFQAWVGRLLASGLLVASSFAGLVRPAAASPVRSDPPIARVVVQDRGAPEEAAVAARPALPQSQGAKRYVVEPPEGRRRDTLWGIAERYLGNPERWPEIFELNKDRVSAGHRMTSPHWIYPGEELIMPADAVGLEPIDGVAPPAPVPAPPSSLSPSSSVAPHVERPSPAAPSSIEMQVIPDEQAAPQADGQISRSTSNGWRVVRTVTDLVPTRLTAVDAVGGGIFAAGVVAAVERRRRRRQRVRRPGAPLLVPDQRLAATELALRVAADVDGADLVQLALKLVRRDAPDAGVLGLRVGARQVALQFVDDPGPASAPFRAAGNGWMLPRRALTPELVAEMAAVPDITLPLVTLGQTDDGESVLLNLLGGTSACVSGNQEIALEFAGAVSTELAAGRWIESGRLLLVGVCRDLASLAGVSWVPSAGSLGVLGAGDVVVSCEPLEVMADGVHSGAAVLAVGQNPDSHCHVFVVDDEVMTVDLLDAVVRPQRLASEKVADIAELLEPPPEPVEEAVPKTEPERQPIGEPLPLSGTELSPPHEVEVRVMGRVEIVGAEKPLSRAKSIELVAFLALHSEAVIDADRLREALWPGRPPGTTLYTTASVARNHLGRASDGELHLPLLPNGERVYRLGKSVGTDYARFAEAVRRAKGEEPTRAMVTLRAALELVRGRPFEVASRGWEWTYVDGVRVCMENEIAGAAHQLARLCLDAGDADGARWAARRGLSASPGNEQLYRDSMEAADLDGNPAGVEALLKELSHVIEEESPLEALHPETVALYNQLMNGDREAHLARTG